MGIEGIFVFFLICKANLVKKDFFIFSDWRYRALGGSFPAPFLFSHFLSLSSTFLAAKHP